LKTPISYYGGKQTMLKHILPLIPKHKYYTEAFCGGLAVYFAKPPSMLDTINDINGELINFYTVCQRKFDELKLELLSTLHSRDLHEYAQFIYSYPWHFTDVKRAWALWILSKMSFASKLDGSFGYDVNGNSMPKKIQFAIDSFNEDIRDRFRNTTIESTDALKIIKSRDSIDTFHFIDPPYINSDCGHYGGYTLQHFIALLDVLPTINGKFMLTMFPEDNLISYVEKYKWIVVEVERTISASKTKRRKQVELMVMNY
jgi:DNA adenine methylase